MLFRSLAAPAGPKVVMGIDPGIRTSRTMEEDSLDNLGEKNWTHVDLLVDRGRGYFIPHC